jgi:ABC-type amino acid transport substrate-binding protein
VGVTLDYPPLSMVDEKGNAKGIAKGIDHEMIKLLNEKLSGRLKVVTGTWQELYDDAVEKRIDVLMSVTPSEERRAYFILYTTIPLFPSCYCRKRRRSSLRHDGIS